MGKRSIPAGPGKGAPFAVHPSVGVLVVLAFAITAVRPEAFAAGWPVLAFAAFLVGLPMFWALGERVAERFCRIVVEKSDELWNVRVEAEGRGHAAPGTPEGAADDTKS